MEKAMIEWSEDLRLACPLWAPKEDIANICVMSVRFSKSGKDILR
jgi:hypothetical protein